MQSARRRQLKVHFNDQQKALYQAQISLKVSNERSRLKKEMLSDQFRFQKQQSNAYFLTNNESLNTTMRNNHSSQQQIRKTEIGALVVRCLWDEPDIEYVMKRRTWSQFYSLKYDMANALVPQVRSFLKRKKLVQRRFQYFVRTVIQLVRHIRKQKNFNNGSSSRSKQQQQQQQLPQRTENNKNIMIEPIPSKVNPLFYHKLFLELQTMQSNLGSPAQKNTRDIGQSVTACVHAKYLNQQLPEAQRFTNLVNYHQDVEKRRRETLKEAIDKRRQEHMKVKLDQIRKDKVYYRQFHSNGSNESITHYINSKRHLFAESAPNSQQDLQNISQSNNNNFTVDNSIRNPFQSEKSYKLRKSSDSELQKSKSIPALFSLRSTPYKNLSNYYHADPHSSTDTKPTSQLNLSKQILDVGKNFSSLLSTQKLLNHVQKKHTQVHRSTLPTQKIKQLPQKNNALKLKEIYNLNLKKVQRAFVPLRTQRHASQDTSRIVPE